jgi:hypothetical protein
MAADHHFSISDPTAAVVTYKSSAATNITIPIQLQSTITTTTTARNVSAAFVSRATAAALSTTPLAGGFIRNIRVA